MPTALKTTSQVIEELLKGLDARQKKVITRICRQPQRTGF